MEEKLNVKKNILFWIDPILIHFCIAKFMQEKFDANYYAIISTNKEQKFLKQQDIVNFKKIFDLRKNYSKGDNKPDYNYLKQIEKKYNLDLWKIIYSDRIFNEHNDYKQFTEIEILSIIEKECKFYEKVLNEIKPDFLIIRMTDDSQNQLIQLISKSMGIKILTLGPARLGSRCMITEETDFLDDMSCENQKIQADENSFEELQKFMEVYSESQKKKRQIYRNSIKNRLVAAMRFFIFVCNNEYREYYVNKGRTRIKVLTTEVLFSLKKIYRERFMNNYLQKYIENEEKFIYFPLQLQPERSTLQQAPFYTNQLHVIENIARSLPIDYQLYVKEHPSQKYYAWREKSYYKKILDFPNVKLIHPIVSNKELIKKSDLVITATGTSGLEAAIYDKPSIVLANVLYEELSSVKKLERFEDLHQTILESIKTKPNFSEISKFIKKIKINSFELDMWNLYGIVYNNFFYDGFLFDVDINLEKLKKFLDTNKEIFSTIAEEHVKKIEIHSKKSNGEFRN